MSAAEDTKRFLINDSSSLRDIFLAYSDSIKPKTSSTTGGPPPPPPPPPQGPPPPPPRQGPSIEYIYKGLSPSRTTAAPPPPRGPPSPKRGPPSPKRGPPSPKRGPPSPKRGPPSPKRGPSPSSSGAATTSSFMMDQPSNKGSSGSSGDKRPSISSLPSSSTSSPVVKKEPKEVEKKTPFRRIRSPSRPRAWLSKVPTSAYKIPGFYKPRYHVHHQENPFHRPGFHHFGFRPYHQYPPGGYFHRRDPPPSALDLKREKDRIREREKERLKDKDRKDDKGSSPKDSLSAPLTPLFPRSTSSREREKQLSSSQDRESDRAQSGERERGRDSTMSRITARNRAIQQKRREIEEVYRQDCDTFAVVVRMLIAKDPQLEPTLQGSLQDNLRDIGHRCVEAMQAFIEEYDAKHAKKDPPPPSSHASPTLARAHSTHSL